MTTKQKNKKNEFDGMFEITLNDGYCTYLYKLHPSEGNNISIDEIWERIAKEFNSPNNKGILIA